MTPNEIIKSVQREIDKFNKSIPKIQSNLYDEIVELSQRLDVRNGSINTSAKNIRLLADIRTRINRLILSPEYKESIKDFARSFKQIEKLQNQYFEETFEKYKPPKTLTAIREVSINETINSLTESGIQERISKPIREILKVNITTGAKYSDLVKSIRTELIENDGLVRYAKQITTDSLNQYARTNIETISSDLGLDWHSYNGGIIEGSRDFCIAMTKKKFFHRSEIPSLLAGDFQEFKDIKGRISDKTGLPYGMIEGTNESNFLVNLGGFFCQHQAVPVPESIVPKAKPVTRLAKEAVPEVDLLANNVADKFNAIVTPINLKSEVSITRKAQDDYDGDFTLVTDAVRNTIIADKSKVKSIVAELRKKDSVTRISSRDHDTDPLGYSGNLINIKTKNGTLGEIQVNTAKMIFAKEKPPDAKNILGEKLWSDIKKETGQEGGLGHKYYEEWRVIKQDKNKSERLKELEELSKEYYSHFID